MLTKDREPRGRVWQVIGVVVALIGALLAILT